MECLFCQKKTLAGKLQGGGVCESPEPEEKGRHIFLFFMFSSCVMPCECMTASSVTLNSSGNMLSCNFIMTVLFDIVQGGQKQHCEKRSSAICQLNDSFRTSLRGGRSGVDLLVRLIVASWAGH